MKNILDSPITTFIGAIVFTAGLSLWLIPYFAELRQEVEWWQYTAAMVVGLLLIVAPDTIVTGLGNLFKRKTDTL